VALSQRQSDLCHSRHFRRAAVDRLSSAIKLPLLESVGDADESENSATTTDTMEGVSWQL
jgi:hypothetical protein